MWMVDQDGYYSSPDRKYLTYDNPFHWESGEETIKQELTALKNALHVCVILNRTLILPSFNCSMCEGNAICTNTPGRCTLNTYIRISAFNAYFGDMYREHTFLNHPKVPQSIKDSISESLVIMTPTTQEFENHLSLNGVRHVFTPQNPTLGVTTQEIQDWLQPFSQAKILSFHSMYGSYIEVEDKTNPFAESLNIAMQKAVYRQY